MSILSSKCCKDYDSCSKCPINDLCSSTSIDIKGIDTLQEVIDKIKEHITNIEIKYGDVKPYNETLEKYLIRREPLNDRETKPESDNERMTLETAMLIFAGLSHWLEYIINYENIDDGDLYINAISIIRKYILSDILKLEV